MSKRGWRVAAEDRETGGYIPVPVKGHPQFYPIILMADDYAMHRLVRARSPLKAARKAHRVALKHRAKLFSCGQVPVKMEIWR